MPASAVLASAATISSNAHLPGDTTALLGEAVLLDTGSAPALASAVAPGATQVAAAESYFVQAIRGIYLERLPDLPAATQNLLKSIAVKGTQPSPAAITPWHSDTFEALFLDTKYSLHTSPIETDWQLDEDQVEMTQGSAPSGATVPLSERSRVTPTMVKVAESRLITRRTTNPVGNPVVREDPPNGLTIGTFQTMDTLSAPLIGFDAALFAQQYRERAGTLSVNEAAVIDIFGVARTFNAGGTAGPSTTLLPRLPYWSRLKLALQSAADLTMEANSHASPVCGILLPDFLDHSLQIFDGTGARGRAVRLRCFREFYQLLQAPPFTRPKAHGLIPLRAASLEFTAFHGSHFGRRQAKRFSCLQNQPHALKALGRFKM